VPPCITGGGGSAASSFSQRLMLEWGGQRLDRATWLEAERGGEHGSFSTHKMPKNDRV
jgi:hypothetical protein